MIGSLRGCLLARNSEAELLIEVGGVGYRVQVTPATAGVLDATDGEVFVYTHQVVREDSDTLYGFANFDERQVFESLISAHGVGPALGLAILAVHEPTALRAAVAKDDLDALCLVPGVGRKTAARLLMELKTKLDIPSDDTATLGGVTVNGLPKQRPHGDVRAALESLGYGPEEIHAVLVEMPEEGEPSELLKDALRRLASVA